MARFSVAINSGLRPASFPSGPTPVLLFSPAGGRRLYAVDGVDMDLSFTPEQEQFRLRLRRWLEENLPAGWGTDAVVPPATYAEEVAFLRDWQAQLYRAGWCGLSWPKEYE